MERRHKLEIIAASLLSVLTLGLITYEAYTTLRDYNWDYAKNQMVLLDRKHPIGSNRLPHLVELGQRN